MRIFITGVSGFVGSHIAETLSKEHEILAMARSEREAGNYSWIDRGQQTTSTTHVANLVEAVRLALTAGRNGEAYFVADDGTRTMHDFLTRLTATAGAELPERSAPSWLVRCAADAVEGLWRVLGKKSTPPLTRFAVYMMSASVTVNDTKARDELGYAPVVSVDEGLAQMKSSI